MLAVPCSVGGAVLGGPGPAMRQPPKAGPLIGIMPNCDAMPPNESRTIGCICGAGGAVLDAAVEELCVGVAAMRSRSSRRDCIAASTSSGVARLMAAMAASRLQDILDLGKNT